jgi:chromosome segregation ATPase
MITNCPTCGKPASGLSCQGCGTRLVEEKKESPPVVSTASITELLNVIESKNKTINGLSESLKSVGRENLDLAKKHAELSAEYQKLLAENSETKAELEKANVALNQPPQSQPETIKA